MSMHLTDARPLQVRIADDLRLKIESGALERGAQLPTLDALAATYGCSLASVRKALDLLRQQGLVVTVQGKGSFVRTQPRRVVRTSERHQEEKDQARKPEDARRALGEAEMNMGVSIDAIKFSTQYDVVPCPEDLAEVFQISTGDPLLRRAWEARDPTGGTRLSYSVSHIPLALVESNPALLDPNNEPWPGGTQNQLMTVGIEIMKMIDEVTARMPTTAERQMWDIPEGVPMLFCRRISIDQSGRIVETSDADYPADRTEMRFVTPLKPWAADSTEETD